MGAPYLFEISQTSMTGGGVSLSFTAAATCVSFRVISSLMSDIHSLDLILITYRNGAHRGPTFKEHHQHRVASYAQANLAAFC